MQNMTWIIIGIVGAAMLLLFMCQPNRSAKVDIGQKIRDGALVVDVRSPMEYEAGHFEGAVNIPINEVERRMSEFGPKDKPVIVYCASGARSGTAERILTSAGYTDVHNGGGLMHMMQYQN